MNDNCQYHKDYELFGPTSTFKVQISYILSLPNGKAWASIWALAQFCQFSNALSWCFLLFFKLSEATLCVLFLIFRYHISNFFFLFVLVWFWSISRDAQGLIRNLTPGDTWNVVNQNWVSHVKGKHLTYCTISLTSTFFQFL